MSTLDGVARILAAEHTLYGTGTYGLEDYGGEYVVGMYSPVDPIPDGVTPITLAVPPAKPDTAICLMTYDGPEPDSRNGWEFPRLQVRVRARNPLDALALDRAAFGVLQARPGQPARTLADGNVLQDCYALQSEPSPLGLDDNGRIELVRNYQLTIEPVTG